MGIRRIAGFISNHPLLVGGLSSLYLLHRFFPSVFVYLVSSSPVIICALLLLGVLLSLSEPNTQQTKEAKRSHSKSGAAGDKYKSSSSGRGHANGKRKKIGLYDGRDSSVSNSKVVTFLNNRYRGIKRDVVVLGASSSAQPVNRNGSNQIEYSRGKTSHGHRQERNKDHEERVLTVQSKDGRLTSNRRRDSEELSLTNIDDNDEALSSISGGGACSSLDASVGDVTSALDELDPLLDLETHNGVPLSDLEGSSIASSLEGTEDEDTENLENEDEEEEEEETQEEKDKGNEVAVLKWTADDEKNLRDVGKSELERNQRLELLIAKRRARSFHRIEVEKNLIDLDSNDAPSVADELSHLLVTIPPRRNPFDLPFSSQGCTGLPPIPGSAPSVLLPRRNPFDLPYDHDTETTGDTEVTFSNQEFRPQGVVPFARQERFPIGPNFAVNPTEERRESRFRPSGASGMASASSGTRYGQFQSQPSDSTSSIPKLKSSHDISNSMTNYAQQNLASHHGPISTIDHSMQQDSQSTSHDACSVETDERQQDIIVNVGHDVDSSVSSGDTDVDNPTSPTSPVSRREQNGNESGPNPNLQDIGVEVVERRNSNSSSTSHSDIHDENINKKLARERGDSPTGSHDSVQSVLAESEFLSRNNEILDDKHTADPVYDSSPSGIENATSNVSSLEEALLNLEKKDLHSCPSLASDMQVELSESGSPRLNDQFQEEEPTTSGDGHWVASSDLASVEQNELRTREVKEISEDDVLHARVARREENTEGRGVSMVSDSTSKKVDQSSGSSSNEMVQNNKMSAKELHPTTEMKKVVVAAKSGPGRLVIEDLATRAAKLIQQSSEDSLPPPSPPTTFGIVETKVSILPSIPEEFGEDPRLDDEYVASLTNDVKHLSSS